MSASPGPAADAFDVVIIGAGAAGLMCALTAGYRGRKVLVIDHANKAGKKILMSGGGRCNFTNLNTTPDHFLSANPHFCISALKRYTPHHFVDMVERHAVDYCEKAPGQLFCVHSSKDILSLLLTECEWAQVSVRLNTAVTRLTPKASHWQVCTDSATISAESVVIATGGLSIPTLGASGFGYQVAEQFGLPVLPTRAGLVPFTLQPADKAWLAPLSGVSLDVDVSLNDQHFTEPMLITHRGLSGPAMLQISSYWQPGTALTLNLLPGENALIDTLMALRAHQPQTTVTHFLQAHWPKRFAREWAQHYQYDERMQVLSNAQLQHLAAQLQHWQLKPSGTEGYRTAEVTLGGVDTRHISSKTFMANDVPGLFFIGEVLDVTGQLGGFNFQWAWASGYGAGEYV